MSGINKLAADLHKETGKTGLELEELVFAVAGTMALVANNTKAYEHFNKRFEDTMAKKLGEHQ